MRIIAKRTLVQFWESGHGDAEQPLKVWYALAKAASWSDPKEIKEKFSTASFLANNRVVFNISGNKYRLVGTYQRCCPLEVPALSTFLQLTAFCFSWATS